jgi:hypothetical protein
MASNDYDIVNLALVRLGANRITSLSDGSVNANEANAIYSLIRDEILRDHPWNFATRYEYLEELNENVLSVLYITAAEPPVVVFTATENPLDGDRYLMESVVGMTQVNDTEFVVESVDPVVDTELVTNGDMELDTSWASVGTPTTNERSTTHAYAGSYSRYFVADAAAEGIRCVAFTTTTGKYYYLSGWVWPSLTTVLIKMYRGAGGATLLKTETCTVVANQWNFVESYWQETVGGSSAYFSITLNGIGNCYCDNFSVYQAGTLELHDEDGAEIDGSAYTAYTSGGTLTFNTPDDHDFSYSWELPSNCLRVLEINHDPDEDFEVIENRVLMCNSDNVEAKVIFQVTDVTKYDSTFVDTFAWRLAMELCIVLTGDHSKATTMAQQYRFALASCKAIDASEGRTPQPPHNRYISSRK